VYWRKNLTVFAKEYDDPANVPACLQTGRFRFFSTFLFETRCGERGAPATMANIADEREERIPLHQPKTQ
jgi:hypothetical protein